MIKSTRAIWTIMLVLVLLLLAGCSGSTEEGGGDPTEYLDEDDPKTRTFSIVSDRFPYPGKKEERIVSDQLPNVAYTIYIYVINPGEQWMSNDVRNVKVTYYDNTRPGVTVEYDQIFIEKYNKSTYIRVDNVSYPQNARGYFVIEGEVAQVNKWYRKRVVSNLFNYGDPGDIPIPINRDYILYEKEYVD